MYFDLIRRPYSLLRSFRLVLALASQANSCSPTSLLLHPLEGLATYACLTHVVLYYAYIHACFRCTEQVYIYLSLYLDIGLYTAKKWYADIRIYNTYANLPLVAMLIRLYIGKCKIADADSMGGPIACLHRRLGPGSLLSDQPLSAHDLAMLTLNILNSCWCC